MTISIKKKSLNFYRQWMRDKCFCPAIKEDVKITWRGWNHIVGNKNNTKRPWPDVYRRLKLLPVAKEIIETSTTIQNIDKRNGNVFFVLEAMKLVTENNIREWRKVRVILIEDKKSKKIFLSVMDKKQKTPKKGVFKNSKK